MADTAPPPEPPVACSLSGADHRTRLDWIAALNADALIAHRRDDLRLVLTYTPKAHARVNELVRRETECCAFLDFALSKERDGLRLSITVPERARATADDVLSPFMPDGAATVCPNGG